MYIMFAMGGIPFFSVPHFMKVLVGIFLIRQYIVYGKGINIKILPVVIYISVIVIIQAIIFSGNLLEDIGFTLLTMVVIPYLAILLVREEFAKLFVNIIYFFSVIGLGFYLLSLLIPPFYHFTAGIASALGTDPRPDVSESFIIYSYEITYGAFLRNSGPFFEPGLYSSYLILAIILNTFNNSQIFDKKNKVLLLANITTFSTAGYIAMFILLIYFIWKTAKKRNFYYVLIPLVVLGSIITYTSTSFMSEKITEQFENQTNQDLYRGTAGRFYGARKSIYVMEKYPFYGRGITSSTAPEDLDSPESTAYGFLNIGSKYGVIAIFLYFLIFIKGLKRINELSVRQLSMTAITLALLAVLFSQGVYFKPIYMMIFYLPIVYNK